MANTESTTVTQAPLRVKLTFWLILSALSVLLAEVVSFNTPLPFSFPTVLWVLLVMIPLYGLHIILLSTLIFKRGRVSIAALYLAGALLGMYEAYLMKQFWLPTWSPDWDVTFAGVYWMHVMTLVVYWHPVMAFILPIFAGETFFTTSRESINVLPRPLRTFLGTRGGMISVVGVIVVYMGARIGMGTRNTGLALTAEASVIAAFAALAILWKRVTRSQQYPFRALMPSGRQARIMTAVLLFIYLWHTFLVRPEAIPRSLIPHLTVWLMYAVLIGMFILHLRAGASEPNITVAEAPKLLIWLVTAGLVMGITSLYIWLKITSGSFDYYGWKTLWYGEWAIGALLLLWTILSLFTGRAYFSKQNQSRLADNELSI
jgi:hypothetical protein